MKGHTPGPVHDLTNIIMRQFIKLAACFAPLFHEKIYTRWYAMPRGSKFCFVVHVVLWRH
jgi:hypothetical protein